MNNWKRIADVPVVYPAWLGYRTTQGHWVSHWRMIAQTLPDTAWTHWQPADAAPEPPTNPDEEAFMQWRTSRGVLQFKDCWQAALAYERSKVKAGERKG